MASRLAVNICENKRQLIETFYNCEIDIWHKTVHENGGAVQENIDDTCRSISEDSIVYEVDCNRETAAMFTKCEDDAGNLVLEAFHVAKEFRTKEFLSEFWKEVKRIFERDFLVGLYEQNKEAVDHLIKQGFEVISKGEYRNKTILIFKICQFR